MIAIDAQRACAFFELINRIPIVVRAYLAANLPARDRRDVARFEFCFANDGLGALQMRLPGSSASPIAGFDADQLAHITHSSHMPRTWGHQVFEPFGKHYE